MAVGNTTPLAGDFCCWLSPGLEAELGPLCWAGKRYPWVEITEINEIELAKESERRNWEHCFSPQFSI